MEQHTLQWGQGHSIGEDSFFQKDKKPKADVVRLSAEAGILESLGKGSTLPCDALCSRGHDLKLGDFGRPVRMTRTVCA